MRALGAAVRVATADGTHGHEGAWSPTLLPALDGHHDYFYACGPEPMLRAVHALCEKPGPAMAQCSFEERMGCGFGGVHGLHAARPSTAAKRICKDGPVLKKGGDPMVEHAGDPLRLDAGQPRHSRQRHVSAMARSLPSWYDINILGTFSFKGTTLEARFGNPTPRIAECPAGMLNAVGLQNPGVRARHRAKNCPSCKRVFHKKVIANVSGFSVEEYARTLRACWTEQEQVGLLEVNISCPNVHGGGMAFGTCAGDAPPEVTRAVKAVTKKPVYMKLIAQRRPTSPYSGASACEDAGADGV